MSKRWVWLLSLLLCLSLFTYAKNVILFIGDGMGPSQISVANYVSQKLFNEQLCFYSFPTISLIDTNNATGGVTDSAAAATALATGVRTNNGVVGLNSNGKSVTNTPEKAKAIGKAVGIITDNYITDATPAGFVAHTASRSNSQEIAKAFLDLKPEVFMGMGITPFQKYYQNGESRDLIQELIDSNYSILLGRNDLIKTDSNKIVGFFTNLDYAFLHDDISTNPPTLREMTKKSLEALAGHEKGFFLMIEGGWIDGSCHNNDIVGTIYGILALNEAVKEALAFLKDHPDTLIIVTADHETGGMSANPATLPDLVKKLPEIKRNIWAIDSLIGNSSSIEWVKAVFDQSGIKKVSQTDLKAIASLSPGSSRRLKIGNVTTQYVGGAKYSTSGHSSQKVLLFAIGQNSDKILGQLRNDELGQLIAKNVVGN